MPQTTFDTATQNLPSEAVNFTASGGGEILSSVSIEKIISCRQHALTLVTEALALLDKADVYFQEAGGAKVFSLDRYRSSDLFTGNADDVLTRITRRNDCHIWRSLMNQSGMLTLMDEQARDAWNASLENEDFPEITHDNILASFQQLNNEKGQVFERGVINVFKSLSWNYKTNLPHMFGKKVILNYVVEYHPQWGFSARYSNKAKLDDLERILTLLDGKPVPDHRVGVAARFSEHVRTCRQEAQDFDSDYFTLRFFKKGTGHLVFKRPDLTEKLNDVLARHYPDALPPFKG